MQLLEGRCNMVLFTKSGGDVGEGVLDMFKFVYVGL